MNNQYYCGNNALRPNPGTRYQCLTKGINIGRQQGGNTEVYVKRTQPSTEKIYCGNSSQLPASYSRFGTNPECLRKGVGVGKQIEFKRFLDNLIDDIDAIIERRTRTLRINKY